MTSDLPAPLTPADCDLRTMPSMPLDVVRLLDSNLVLLGNGEEFKAAVTLWCKSWLQVPAASLPDDDRILAKLSGADGRWKKLRDRAMSGWVKCGDGRLYHPVVAEKANIAWNQRKAQRDRANLRWGRERDGAPPPSSPGTKPANADASPISDAAAHATEHAAAYPNADAAASTTAVPTADAAAMQAKQSKAKQEAVPASRTQSARKPRPAGTMPTLADPPAAWLHLADKREVDGSGVERPVVGGFYLDIVAMDVCNAAGINGRAKAMDWNPLIGWLRAGIDPNECIVPTIQRVASRHNYTPPHSLAYFDNALREQRAAA